MNIVIVRVRADVNDAVHVEVEVVELGNLMLFDHLAEARVSLWEPPIEFWNTHDRKPKSSVSQIKTKFSEIEMPGILRGNIEKIG